MSLAEFPPVEKVEKSKLSRGFKELASTSWRNDSLSGWPERFSYQCLNSSLKDDIGMRLNPKVKRRR
jgi:hypothetical protein